MHVLEEQSRVPEDPEEHKNLIEPPPPTAPSSSQRLNAREIPPVSSGTSAPSSPHTLSWSLLATLPPTLQLLTKAYPTPRAFPPTQTDLLGLCLFLSFSALSIEPRAVSVVQALQASQSLFLLCAQAFCLLFGISNPAPAS